MSGDNHNQADEAELMRRLVARSVARGEVPGTTAGSPSERLAAVTIATPAQPYYDRTSDDDAIAIALDMIQEWDYETDAHGYCHVRPTLLRLVEIALRGEVSS